MRTETSVRDRVQEIFRNVLGKPDLVVHDALAAKDVDNWDSVNNIVIVMELEEKLGVTFTTAELAGMQHVGDLFRCLASKGVS